MSQELQKRRIPPHLLPVLAEIKELYGPPPVLSTENMQAYEEMTCRFIVCFTPQDSFQTALIKDVIDGTWEAARWARHKALSMHRRLEVQAQRRKAMAQKKAALAKRPADSKAEPATEPEEALDHVVEDVDAMLLEPATELDHNRALEVGIVYVEKLDKLQMMAIARRNNAIAELERWREKMGYRLSRLSDELIGSASSHRSQQAAPTDRLGRPIEAMAPPGDHFIDRELGVVPSSETEQVETSPDSSAG
jgi:hypothetical protein